jgi:hypothetical protein
MAVVISGDIRLRYVVTGAGHGNASVTGDAKAGYAWSTQEVMDVIARFLGKHLKG